MGYTNGGRLLGFGVFCFGFFYVVCSPPDDICFPEPTGEAHETMEDDE